MLAHLLAAGLWLGAESPTLAADADPVERALKACMAKPGGDSTVGMVDCLSVAIHDEDRRLNEVYQRVQHALDPKSRELLRTAQRRWVEFRAAEDLALDGPWRDDRGSMARVSVMSHRLSAIKERVQELSVYDAESE